MVCDLLIWLPLTILHAGHLKVRPPSYKCNMFALNVVGFNFLLLFLLEFETMEKCANTYANVKFFSFIKCGL